MDAPAVHHAHYVEVRRRSFSVLLSATAMLTKQLNHFFNNRELLDWGESLPVPKPLCLLVLQWIRRVGFWYNILQLERCSEQYTRILCESE